MPERTLSHLRALEAESIHIIREVAAEFERPVMLYSIGKDSCVMVRLAQKAFSNMLNEVTGTQQTYVLLLTLRFSGADSNSCLRFSISEIAKTFITIIYGKTYCT